jgi:hypothetical protein
MFEMFSKTSKIIVQPEEDIIYLHGVRHLETLEEEDPTPIAEQHSWKLVPSYAEQVPKLSFFH